MSRPLSPSSNLIESHDTDSTIYREANASIERTLGGHVTQRLLRHFLFWLAGVIVVGVSVLYGFILYANRDQVSSFYVIDAELRDPIYLDRLDQSLGKSDIDREEFGFNAHRLKIGHGLVLAHRAFLGGSTAIDDESYMKLTIWLPAETPPTGKQTLNSPGQALMVYSSGGSAWPRNDCSGYVNGSIVIVPQGHSLNVRVEGEFQPKGNSAVRDHCKPRSVALEFRAAPERFDRLTPWQGGIGGLHPYDETFPGERKAATRDSIDTSTTQTALQGLALWVAIAGQPRPLQQSLRSCGKAKNMRSSNM